MNERWFRRIVGENPRRTRWLVAVVLLLAAAAGLATCTGERVAAPELTAPAVFYVSGDPDDVGTSTDDLRLGEGPRRGTDVTVAVDTRGLAGVVTLKGGLDNCPVRPGTFRCVVHPADPGIQIFHLRPARGARPGDTAVLRTTLTGRGARPVTRRTTLVVGKPSLAVSGVFAPEPVRPGRSTALSAVVRNTGDAPARGVVLAIEVRDGARLTDRHGNCRYRGGSSVRCRVEAADTVIPPGAAFRIALPEQVRTAGDAGYPTVGITAYAGGTEPAVPPVIARQYHAGDGPALRLVPATPGEAAARHPAAPGWDGVPVLTVPVLGTSDLAAVAPTVRGPVGSRARVRVGVRNQGPKSLPREKVSITFTLPAGTTAVASPYDSEADEELVDQACRALAPDGTPLTSASLRQPRARRYVCTAVGGASGSTTTFPFTLRIDRRTAHGGGSVTVDDEDPARGSGDTRLGDNAAPVVVRVWPGAAWATPRLYGTGAVLAGLAALAALLVVGERRHGRARH